MSLTDYPDPLQVPDNDPGDETQRNFRYQSAFGVLLLLAGFTDKQPYSTIYCEHHEDLLCQRADDTYDAWQIKTRQAEHGYWQLNHEPLKKSIKRFTELIGTFGDRINCVYFASNAGGLVTTAKDKIHKSPKALCDAVQTAVSPEHLSPPFDKAFKSLQDHCQCEASVLFATLARMRVTKGPSREDYEATISHAYIASLPGCESLSRSKLNSIRDELISIITRASSISRDVASFDWIVDANNTGIPPEVQAKQVFTTAVDETIRSHEKTPFRYLEGTSNLSLDSSSSSDVMECKLNRGGLSNQLLTMNRRMLSTEAKLLEDFHADPDMFDSTLDQLVGVVQGVCDDADVEAQVQTGTRGPFGPRKMLLVRQKLEQVAENNPAQVDGQPYEVLMGVSGILTNECSIWWSNPFDLGDCS